MKYKNYIFDLYGTLVDIRTDERQRLLWAQLAEMYSCYGADYTPEQIRDAYHYLCKSEDKKIFQRYGFEYPEIDLTNVFLRLLVEAPKTHPCENGPKSWGKVDAERWAFHTASIFRILSRVYCRVYPGTIETLQKIKDNGGRIFLLSNAQRIFTIPELETSGLLPFFNDIYISSDKQIKKPQKEFLEQLLQEHHLRKDKTVMIGNDFASDIAVAMKNGIDSVYLNTDHCDARLRKKLWNAVEGKPKNYVPRVIASGKITELI